MACSPSQQAAVASIEGVTSSALLEHIGELGRGEKHSMAFWIVVVGVGLGGLVLVCCAVMSCFRYLLSLSFVSSATEWSVSVKVATLSVPFSF